MKAYSLTQLCLSGVAASGCILEPLCSKREYLQEKYTLHFHIDALKVGSHSTVFCNLFIFFFIRSDGGWWVLEG